MGTLFRYWIVPAKLRRLPRWARISISGFGLLLTLALSCCVFYPVPQSYESDYNPLLAQFTFLPRCAYNLLPSLLCTLGLFAGATAIAPERQKQTWEALLLTRMRLTEVVHAKLYVRIAQCLLLTLPLYLPLLFAYGVYSQNNLQYFFGTYDAGSGQNLPLSPSLVTSRLWIYLIWTCVSTGGHLLMGTLLGIAVSAHCRKLQTALIICSTLIAFYAGTYFWCQSYYYYPDPGDPNLHAHLYYWPAVPYLELNYSGTAPVPSAWKLNLIADVIWMIALPTACYFLTLGGCRLRRGRKPPRTSDAIHPVAAGYPPES